MNNENWLGAKQLSLATSLRLLSTASLVICGVVFVLPPALYFEWAMDVDARTLRTEALLNAQSVLALSTQQPDSWSTDLSLLQELFSSENDVDDDEERRSVFSASGQLLLEQSAQELDAPRLTELVLIGDPESPIGSVAVTRSVRHVWLESASVAVGSLVFSGLLLWFMRGVLLSALRQAIEKLQEEKERALITLRSIGDAVITTDSEMRVQYLNPVAESLTGWTTEEAQGLLMDEVFFIVQEESRAPAVNPIKECLQSLQIVEMENHTVLVRRGDGQEFHIEDSAAPILHSDGRAIGAVMVFHDVTERKASQQQLKHTAFHDTLTGLPNRQLFRNRILTATEASRADGTITAVLFLDLDRFKGINDSLGHSVGDELLILVAKRLRQCVRESDTVARMGGDEFTAVLGGIHSVDNVRLIGEKMLASLANPFHIEGQHLRISTSIGVSLFPQDADNLEDLLKLADSAMYQAKDSGRNNVQFYTPDLNTRATEKLQLEYALHTALENNEYALVYQPKLDLTTGKILGVEALLRWVSPERGIVMPGDFIDRLEETGRIVQVGLWVLKTAIQQAKHWLDAGCPKVVSVNVSAYQLRQSGLVADIAGMLDAASLPAKWLQIELTESLLMNDADRSDFLFADLLGIGVGIALDDFGTGYSSLGYLRKFPIQELKIDRSFVTDIDSSETAERVVKTVVELGQALNMYVTAEGVETAEQLLRLRAMGCDAVQGFHLARPMDSEALDVWLTEFQPSADISFEI
ncbi:EAL domain-containing protein [Rhodoferax sp.]|uniref:putative bifunctional diguanylate cyclase/phosphodiesterase n=1 Tax=Rhodoferax sp. TaxID=50421 RepID=UPI0025EF150D|nr:EAL domain-containing protein [Rhodoferax sp.]